MGLRDLFTEKPDGTYKNRIGSVGEALVEEKNKEFNEENPEPEYPETGYDQSGGLGQNDNMMMDQSQGVGPNEKFLNRMISIKGIPKPIPGAKEPGFLFDPDWMENYILNSFSGLEQKQLWRRLQDIIHLSQGDGNSELVRSKSMSFAFRILTHRSRNDTPMEMTERSSWIEHRSTSKNIQRIHQTGSSRSSGVLARIFGK
jgi:hypothetical protein